MTMVDGWTMVGWAEGSSASRSPHGAQHCLLAHACHCAQKGMIGAREARQRQTCPVHVFLTKDVLWQRQAYKMQWLGGYGHHGPIWGFVYCSREQVTISTTFHSSCLVNFTVIKNSIRIVSSIHNFRLYVQVTWRLSSLPKHGSQERYLY